MVVTPQQPTPSPSRFDEAYATRTAPWVIGEPQPAIVTLERQGWIRGKVLDVECGSGEHVVALNHQIGELVDLPAWLTRARRL